MNGFITDALQRKDDLTLRNMFLQVVAAVGNLSYELYLANLIISGNSFCFGFNFLPDLIKISKDLKQNRTEFIPG